MSSIRIQHVGAIVDTGMITLSPIMLIVGKQSSGKSTFMKIACFCRWIEKRIMIDGENLLKKYTHYNRFLKDLKDFYRMDDGFFNKNTSIEYDGECISIELTDISKNVKIVKKGNFKTIRHNTKLSFIPSERNLVSAIQNIDKAYKASDYDSIFNYLLKYQEAKKLFDAEHPLPMPFDDSICYYYNKEQDADRIILRNSGREMMPLYASSGVQSAFPLTVLTQYTARQVGKMPKSSLTDLTSLVAKMMLDNENGDDMSDNIKKASKMYRYESAHLYIEELEENLFPESQFEMVKMTVECIKQADEVSSRKGESTVMMTSHSPYVLTSLNVLMKAAMAKEQGYEIPASLQKSIVPSQWFSAYCLNEQGLMENIVDHEYHFIKGDYLDSLSDEISALSSFLDDKLYGFKD